MSFGRFSFPLTALACFSALGLYACSNAVDENSSTIADIGAPLPDSSSDDRADMASARVNGWTGEGTPRGEGDVMVPDPAQIALPTPTVLPHRGVNLAGGEFGTAIPGVEGRDYKFPTTAEVDYFVAKGMNTFRIGFKWERLQAQAYGSFDATYLSRIDDLVAYISKKGATVILNPHNFARYYGVTVGSTTVPNAVFADFWKKMADRYGKNPRVVFNLVNEPSEMPTEQWVGAANAAISAIRSTGSTNLLHVPGNGWTGAHSWYQSYYGTPNATAMKAIVDPADNMMFEVHQYLDASAGGKNDVCMSTTEGRKRLEPFVRWLRENGKKGFVGEFAGGDNATCDAAIKDMVAYMKESGDVLDGWLWWAAGPGWGNYPFSIEPVSVGSAGKQDRPLMKKLALHLEP